MAINDYLKDKSCLIERRLDELIPEKNVPYNQLYRAARYALLGGGKRLRPILTLATVEMFGTPEETALTPACALEMVHTYSLIHDDLPCMDDDDYRRGKPSLHKAFPEGHAVLTGDYLLTYAFEVLASSEGISAPQKIQLMHLLAKNAGGEGMVGGQVMDLEGEGQPLKLETLRQIHQYKTGAMISASIEFGGILANASDEQMHHLKKFGENIGLAFQIIDDLLDVTASEQKHGKKTSSDQQNNKTTYVTLLGIEQSMQTAQALLHQAITHLNHIKKETSTLMQLAEHLIFRAN